MWAHVQSEHYWPEPQSLGFFTFASMLQFPTPVGANTTWTRDAVVWRRALQCLVSSMTNFTWLLEADQLHQHCSSAHPGPSLAWGHSVYIHGTCAIHVWPEELRGTAGRSAGRLHTHVQPWPLFCELLDDEHNCHQEVPGKPEPFQAKGECLAFLQPPGTVAQEILL